MVRFFLRGRPIGGPLSRDDCNTFGAAYNMGTRGRGKGRLLSLSSSLPLVHPWALLCIPELTLEAIAEAILDSAVAQRHIWKSEREGGHFTVSSLLCSSTISHEEYGSWLMGSPWILVSTFLVIFFHLVSLYIRYYTSGKDTKYT